MNANASRLNVDVRSGMACEEVSTSTSAHQHGQISVDVQPLAGSTCHIMELVPFVVDIFHLLGLRNSRIPEPRLRS